ncbi:hypothetical protein RRG51_01365 [Mycoplasmopsis cynos]|uniref:MMB_0454 family protein n=1 Tax=Mycoplasmopsis cynos TaxID=171284 RepID=UPI002AFFBB63|nr:hypothetical protein [Mycoplasmopsis cynos]WQQ16399.1 hypothetical protein RRG51_01365 [Mycoplasmopsis cynos]
MSNWVNVPYHSNQVYVVKEDAFKDVIKYFISQDKRFKLNSPVKILINEKHTDLQIFLEIKIKSSEATNSFNVIKYLISGIEEEIKKLIDKKPCNVQVSLCDYY